MKSLLVRFNSCKRLIFDFHSLILKKIKQENKFLFYFIISSKCDSLDSILFMSWLSVIILDAASITSDQRYSLDIYAASSSL